MCNLVKTLDKLSPARPLHPTAIRLPPDPPARRLRTAPGSPGGQKIEAAQRQPGRTSCILSADRLASG